MGWSTWPGIKEEETGKQDFPLSAKISCNMKFHPGTADVLMQHFFLLKIYKDNSTIRRVSLHHSC